jgi:DNA-binding XRE family transcriptional regulator
MSTPNIFKMKPKVRGEYLLRLSRNADKPPRKVRSPFIHEVGALLRVKRKDRGLSLEQIASLTGISYCVLSNIENGSGNPGLETLEKIAASLGCRISLEIVRLKDKNCGPEESNSD